MTAGSTLRATRAKKGLAAEKRTRSPYEGGGLVRLDREEQLHNKRLYWFGRRAQDIVFSLLAMLVLSPVLALTALIIYLDDPHASPIFSQIRCGRDGKPFRMYKFRSMYADAEERLQELLQYNEMDGPAFKVKNDPRVTRFGHFLRKTSLDEWPQLWNILKGDMSFVGPRPALPREVAKYNALQRQRLMITPGLTCYWQIRPQRNTVRFDEWVALDLKYIQERSFLVDWKILWGTVKAVLWKQGI